MANKYAAYGIALKAGTAQVETAVIATDAAAITGNGNGDVVLTHAGMTGTPITTVVALLIGDTPDDCARKMAVGMNLDSDITDHMTVVANGPNVIMELVGAAADDGTLNMAYADNTSAGLTDDATSNNTTAGVAAVEIASVKNIGGPSLSLDTEDVTTHDQATSFEENVGTVLRSGEISLDIVYDPANATHDASTGLVYRKEDKIRTHFDLVFFSTYNWTFFGLVTGFEPTGDIGSALGATVKVKITGQPTLE